LIDIERLRKTFGEVTAVSDVSFSARPGEIFGLLGPNGAGKTTTINCICGLVTPTSGSVRVTGHDVVTDGRAARASLGVVPQEVALFEDLSARENLEYWGGAQGMRNPERRARVQEVLALAGLQDRAKEPVKRFSGGMKRRLNFACGIVHKPRVLLLDEPTVGVDPQSRRHLLDLVKAQARAGATVLYTSHYLQEAEELCDRLAVIDHGRIIAQGTLAELRAMLGEQDLLRFQGAFQPDVVRREMQAEPGVEVTEASESQLALSLAGASHRLPAIFAALARAGAEVRGTTLIQPSLESLFIKLTGRDLRE
jgi:ABC-2 type transport system ATP-binding protein